MNKRSSIHIVITILMVLSVGAGSTVLGQGINADDLPKPANISCGGYYAGTARIRWTDNAPDETEWRVYRQVNGVDWIRIATLEADNGLYLDEEDLGADVDLTDRRYRVRSYRSGDDNLSPASDICNGRRVYETENVRVFYGVEGLDDCPPVSSGSAARDVCLKDDADGGGTNNYARRAGDAAQDTIDALDRLGFALSPADHPKAGMDKMPFPINWCDGGGCANGKNRIMSVAPVMLEEPALTGIGDPDAWVVTMHEVFHMQQYKYYKHFDDPAGAWVTEAQARSIQDKICLGADRGSCQHFDAVTTGAADYIAEIGEYMGRPDQSIIRASYNAVLFWTYLVEKFGTAPVDDVEGGMNLILTFWEQANTPPDRDGITIINDTLAELGHSETFRDVWRDFAVANYAKDYAASAAQEAKYHYVDMDQPGGTYAKVQLENAANTALGTTDQIVLAGKYLPDWAAHYYEVLPAADVPLIDLKITRDNHSQMYFTLLAIKGGQIVKEENFEGQDLEYSLPNDGYDRVALVAATFEGHANYRLSINGQQPELNILYPTTATRARVGDPAAPDKFRVVVELVDGGGRPLEGVDLDQFSFTVGGQDVVTDSMLTAATIMGQHWFLLRAPAQTSAGAYDLVVDYGAGPSNFASNAVDYQARDDADSMIVIDRSGSMVDDDKMAAAQDAARLFVDSWRGGDQIGVVSFNDTATVEMGLSGWTDSPGGGTRQTAFGEINALTASGGTAIGDALQAGWDELTADGSEDHDWAMVLLSDGLQTAGSKTFDSMITALRNNSGQQVVVHSVAVGGDADRDRMQRLAMGTGGSFQYVAVPVVAAQAVQEDTGNLFLDLAARYRMIAAKVIGQQQIFSQSGELGVHAADDEQVSIPVDGGAAELVLSLTWDVGIGPAALRNPSNGLVAPFQTDSNHMVWRVTNPTGGVWNLDIDPKVIGDVAVLSGYFVQASLRSEVTMDAYLVTPGEYPAAGLPVTFLASLTDNGPITGATVTAKVQPQSASGSDSVLSLYDDGQHGDGGAGDGIYGATYHDTHLDAPYNVTLTADGTSPLSGAFHREEILSFYPEHKDSDGDGMSDGYEEFWGTDPDVQDENDDPDGDVLPNGTEEQQGTDPFNWDTDGDGESDASDPDPLDPTVGGAVPPWAVAYPDDGQVVIKYTMPSDYARIWVYRGDNVNGPFGQIGALFGDGVTGTYTDTTVTNDSAHCYIIWARDNNFHESVTPAPACATPRADPWPPHGLVKVEDGDADGLVPLPQVTLQLWASDAVDPHEHDGGPLPPVTSASGVVEMKISNRGDFEGAAWEPFAPTKGWTLAQASGLNYVFAQFRDAAGNESQVESDTIYVGSRPFIVRAKVFLPLVLRQARP